MVISGSEQRTAGVLEREAINDFNGKLHGRLMLPDESGYDDARSIWNAMIDKHPALIVQPVGVADVINAVNFAREHELLLAIKGGGHNVAGNAACDGGLMIDMSKMNSVIVDPEARTAYVEGGALWQDFDHETAVFNLATTGGMVSTTGVAGLTLGGGVGWLIAKFGMACDNVLAFDLVLADGSFVRASRDEHPDLYWALRGGGGNFGVVTGFQFQLHSLNDPVIAGAMLFPIDRVREIAYTYRDFSSKASNDLGDYFAVLTEPESGERVVAIAVCHTGTPEAAKAEIAPVQAIQSPIFEGIDQISYTDWQQAEDIFWPYGWHRYWKSHMVKELSDDLLDTLAEWADSLPSDKAAFVIEHYHGKYSEPGKKDTAYWHRDAPYQIAIIDQWTDPIDADESIQWVRDLYDALIPFSTNAPYHNFNMFDDAELVDRVRAGFGGNYERLVQVKNKYDPTNFFRVNNNIKPTV